MSKVVTLQYAYVSFKYAAGSADIFQAMEKPELLLADVEAYVKKAWKGADKDSPAR